MIWLSAAAWGGDFDGELALDALTATSTSGEPRAGEGTLSASELGMRIRGALDQGAWRLAVDYQGREPVAGAFPDSAERLLYRAEIARELVPDHLTAGVGRFVAPAVVFLPVDGARLTWTPSSRARLELFGGRRGASSSRRELGFDAWLPAAGGALGLGTERIHTDLRAAVAGDEVALGTPEAPDPDPDRFTAFSGTVSSWGRPAPTLTLGGTATVAQRATFVLAASPASAAVDVTAADLYQGLAWASWEPSDAVGVDADALRQSALLVAGPTEADPPGPDAPLVDPTFTDLRLRGRIRPADLGWLRPDVRLRLRSALDGPRTELRWGAGADADHLPIDGWFVHGEAYVDDVLSATAPDDAGAVDRLLWVASTGYERGPVQVEAGSSFVDRALGPVSARSGAATASDDLSPFVLEAQNVVFARGFWAHRSVFGGADLEVSTTDPEVRAFVQVGFLPEVSW